ncbi:hypothetical protein D3C81_2144270 [compost metagenome]
MLCFGLDIGVIRGFVRFNDEHTLDSIDGTMRIEKIACTGCILHSRVELVQRNLNRKTAYNNCR